MHNKFEDQDLCNVPPLCYVRQRQFIGEREGLSMANVAQEIPSSQAIFAQRGTSVDGPSYQQLNGNQNFGAVRLMRDGSTGPNCLEVEDVHMQRR